MGLHKPKEKAKWRFMQKYYHKVRERTVCHYPLTLPLTVDSESKPTSNPNLLITSHRTSFSLGLSPTSSSPPFPPLQGAFFLDPDSVQDPNDVRLRSTDEPTLEDKFNKEMLPAVMQVREARVRARV